LNRKFRCIDASNTTGEGIPKNSIARVSILLLLLHSI